MSANSFVHDCRPPWVVFPDLDARQLVGYLRQGATEAYFLNVWRPFWDSLDQQRRAEYLDHWGATPAWREAIEFHFNEDPSLDPEADARESEEHLARYRQEKAAALARRPWWARLFRSGN